MKHFTSILRGSGASLLLLGTSASAQITFTNGSTVATGQRPDAVAFGDFDLDGDQDFAVSTGPQGGGNLDAVEIYSNDGSGNFSMTLSILTGANTGPAGLVATDFTNNGLIDIAVTLHNANSVLILNGNGAGGFTMGASTPTGADPRQAASADMDNDGDLDLVTSNRASNSVSVLLNNGAGLMSLSSTTTLGVDLRGVALGDFNNDGLADVAVSSHDTRELGVMLNVGGGNLGGASMLSVGASRRPEGLVAGDFNGDGLLDLAAATSLNNDSWATLFSNLGGSFAAPQHFLFLGAGADHLVAADFDLDGDLDLATSNQDTNNVSILSNFGASFGSPTLVNSKRPTPLQHAPLTGPRASKSPQPRTAAARNSAQRAGTRSATWLAGCVATFMSTSAKYSKGSTPAARQLPIIE